MGCERTLFSRFLVILVDDKKKKKKKGGVFTVWENAHVREGSGGGREGSGRFTRLK